MVRLLRRYYVYVVNVHYLKAVYCLHTYYVGTQVTTIFQYVLERSLRLLSLRPRLLVRTVSTAHTQWLCRQARRSLITQLRYSQYVCLLSNTCCLVAQYVPHCVLLSKTLAVCLHQLASCTSCVSKLVLPAQAAYALSAACCTASAVLYMQRSCVARSAQPRSGDHGWNPSFFLKKKISFGNVFSGQKKRQLAATSHEVCPPLGGCLSEASCQLLLLERTF